MAIRILIADDNALVRRALALALRRRGNCEIIEAENGEQSILKAKDEKPDLIILDLAMPAMDGIRAARAIALNRPAVPIILHTLHWNPRVELEALRAGVRKVVAKSDSAAILAAVEEFLPRQMIGYVATIEEPEIKPIDPVTILPAAGPAEAPAATRQNCGGRIGSAASGPATRSTAE